ncbi:MAG TPA: response regulator [Fibrobacteria bacterium]|nr:response regulator [Fibrobacteria bacterium]
MNGRILAVDDNVDNLRLLESILSVDGHEVRAALNGETALRALSAGFAELVLLDVSMPGMDGYEVCRRMKADPGMAQVPVLFLSAHQDLDAKLEGFEAGGQDYVTKPFLAAEVLARVRMHLRVARAERDLVENMGRLRELERLRDDLVHLVVHDMRSPLTGICGNLELAAMEAQSLGHEKLGNRIRKAVDSAMALNNLSNTMLDLSRLEEKRMPVSIEPCDAAELARQAWARLGSTVEHHFLELGGALGPGTLHCDRDLTLRILQNLVSNAVHHAPFETTIGIRCRPGTGRTRVEILDHGRGVPEGQRGTVFEKFRQVEEHRKTGYHSSGLGLTFCKLAVEAQGGEIGVENAPGAGALFWFTLPQPTQS